MTALVYVFIIMAILMGMFCMFVIARDVVIEEKERRQKKNNNTNEVKPKPEEKPMEVNEVTSVRANVAMDEVAPTTAVSDDSAVVFSTATQTLEEK